MLPQLGCDLLTGGAVVVPLRAFSCLCLALLVKNTLVIKNLKDPVYLFSIAVITNDHKAVALCEVLRLGTGKIGRR